MTLSARSGHWVLGTRPIVPGQARFRFASRLREWLAGRWRFLVSSRALPADLRTLIPVEPGERVLSVGRDCGDGYALVATDVALYCCTAEDGWSRLGWEYVTRVGWDTAASSLVITVLTGDIPGHVTLPLRERGTAPELAAERITHTRLGCWQVPLAAGKHILAEARRRPATGEVLWFVSCDGSKLDLNSDSTREQVQRAIDHLVAVAGIASPSGAYLSRVIERPRSGGTASTA